MREQFINNTSVPITIIPQLPWILLASPLPLPSFTGLSVKFLPLISQTC